MLTAKLFKNADIKCADDYIMLSTYTCDCTEIIDIIVSYGVEEMILSPVKSMIRITLKEALDNEINVITIEKPTHGFLKQLWDLNVEKLRKAVKTYIVESSKIAGIEVWENGKWNGTEVSDAEHKWIIDALLMDDAIAKN